MIKYFILFLIAPLLINAQIQIGQDINGEFAGDQSGWCVRASSDGSVIAIGAPQNDGNGNNSGHVRVYRNVSGTWTQIGQDIDGEASNDFSGDFEAVSISSDGSIIAIGGLRNDGNGTDSGHVRVYQYNGVDTWIQLGQDIDGENAEDESGTSVSLSADGAIVAIGALYNDGNGNNSGHVRVYQYNNVDDAWEQLGQDIDGEQFGDQLGRSVALSSDGNIVAVGAPVNPITANIGYFKVYQYNGVDSWEQIGQKVLGELNGDQNAWSISISNDGTRVASGAPTNDGNGDQSGHVRVYQYNFVTDNWDQIGQDIDGENEIDQSGRSVSLSGDGNIVAIGAHENDGNGNAAGHVRVYQFNGINEWVQIGSDIDGEAEIDLSGRSVSISSDGSTLIIGANGNDGNGNESGHARIYDLGMLLSNNEFAIKQFTLFPNPAKDMFRVQLSEVDEIYSIRIYNNLGQLIKFTNNSYVSTSNFNSGTYFVVINTNKGIATKKLIIN